MSRTRLGRCTGSCGCLCDEKLAANAPQSCLIERNRFAFIQEGCAQSLVEFNCGTIPVEYFPSQAEAALVERELGDRSKQGFANAVSTELVEYEQVFKEKRRATFVS